MTDIQFFALPVVQAIWLASIVAAVICFAVASLVPKSWRSALSWVTLGVLLVGSGWCYRKVVQLDASEHLNDTNWDKDTEVPQLRDAITKLVPMKTPLVEAKSRMEGMGFVCTAVDEIHSLPYRVLVPRTISLPPAMHLFCRKEDRWPKNRLVTRRWEVDFGFPPHQSPNPGVEEIYVRCAHYLWRVFLFWTFAYP